MFAKEILIFTLVGFVFSQPDPPVEDPTVPPSTNGIARLASSSLKGVGTLLNSGAHATASGVELTTNSMANGVKTLGGAADLANNVQQMKFDALRQARHAAGRFGASLADLSMGALTGILRRGAEAVDATRRATEFVLGESDKVHGASKRVAKSLVSNTSGSFVNVLNGVGNVVDKGGEVREEVADTAGAIHDASTDLVKEGVRTWKDLGLSSIGSIKAGMQEARKRARGGQLPDATTQNQMPQTQSPSAPTPVKEEPKKPAEETKPKPGSWFGW
nr:PREDICTED: uncharacterized protein LOC109034557 [Bemisia tabaci]